LFSLGELPSGHSGSFEPSRRTPLPAPKGVIAQELGHFVHWRPASEKTSLCEPLHDHARFERSGVSVQAQTALWSGRFPARPVLTCKNKAPNVGNKTN
jgi:hypothetical protein